MQFCPDPRPVLFSWAAMRGGEELTSNNYLAASGTTCHYLPSSAAASSVWPAADTAHGDLGLLLQAQLSHQHQSKGLREKHTKQVVWKEKQFLIVLDVAPSGETSASATVMMSGYIYNHWKEENSSWASTGHGGNPRQVVWGLGHHTVEWLLRIKMSASIRLG